MGEDDPVLHLLHDLHARNMKNVTNTRWKYVLQYVHWYPQNWTDLGRVWTVVDLPLGVKRGG